jgi:type II secretory pathway component GspD/PulD (secretin)
LTGGFLSYNLNIANSIYTKNEVIARPTLSAIDRLPSIFFSGATYSIIVGGINSGTLVDKPVGVALSVTPTFLDDDKILLSIRASRSFIEEQGNEKVALKQTRNAVNASALVSYGQTFVLNGLVERELDVTENGVPLLQDIPILQYFFKRSVTMDYSRQILTLVTVRKLVDSEDSIAKAKTKGGLMSSHKMSDQVQEYLDLQNNKPVLDEVLAGLRADNGLYTKLRQRDLIQESYGSKSIIKRLIEDIKDLAYF